MTKLLLLFCLDVRVATAFTVNNLASPVSKSVPLSKASIVNSRRIPVLSMVAEDESSNNLPVLDNVESVVASISAPTTEQDAAKEIVKAVMSDPSAADFIGDDGIVSDVPTTTTDDVFVDMMPSSETVSAFLAVSEEAVAAAEAKLSAEEAEMVPLIPKQAQNDTFGVDMEGKEIPTILPASQVVGEPITAVPTEIETPNVKKILKFAVPAIGVWLCGPLLSLIDTSTVGLFSGTFQQAALNPAVAVTDYAALLIVSVV